MDNTIDSSLKKEYVKNQACFSKLTEEETDKLAELFTEIHVAPGETIVVEGNPVDSVYLIISGQADVRHVTIKDHSEQIQSLATLGPGQAIGLNETGFYSLSGIRTATVVAITDMVLLRLSVAQFHGFALEYSHVNQVMRVNAEAVLGKDS